MTLYKAYIRKEVEQNAHYIESPKNGDPVWIAIVKDDGSTFLPEETTSEPEAFDNYYYTSDGSLDTLLSVCWRYFRSAIHSHSRHTTFNSFAALAKDVLARWTKKEHKKQPQNYGATCRKCNSFNEYFPASNDYICKSCKSFEDMYA